MATFGNTNVEANQINWGPSVDKMVGNRFNLPENGILTEIWAYLGYYYDVPVRACIYDDQGNLIALSEEIMVRWGWYKFPFPSGVPLATGNYWLCVATSDDFIYWYAIGVGEHIAVNLVNGYANIPSTLASVLPADMDRRN